MYLCMFCNNLLCFDIDLVWCHKCLQTDLLLENVWGLDRKHQYWFFWTVPFQPVWENDYDAELSSVL